MATDYYAGVGPGFYDLFSTGLPGDVGFYVAQAQAAGSPVLELACGTGRVTISIAAAGVQVLGLDLSPQMLARFKSKLPGLPVEVRGKITLMQGDMRSFDLRQRFALVIIPYRAFLHNLTVAEQLAALQAIGRHLPSGGRLALNVFDPDLRIIIERSGEIGQALTPAGEFTRPDNGHQVVVWESRQYDIAAQMVRVRWLYDELGDDGLVLSRAYTDLHLRWVYRYEMEHLLARSGFAVEALYGGFEGEPFVAGGEQVWLARKL